MSLSCTISEVLSPIYENLKRARGPLDAPFECILLRMELTVTVVTLSAHKIWYDYSFTRFKDMMECLFVSQLSLVGLLGSWLFTEMVCPPEDVIHPSTNRPDVKQLRWSRGNRYHYAKPPNSPISVKNKTKHYRVWADAQRGGHPAEYRWRPLRKFRNCISCTTPQSLADALCWSAVQ